QSGVNLDPTQFSPTQLGSYQVSGTIQSTPATDLATGKTKIGNAPRTLQQDAIDHGFDLSNPSTIVALGYVNEIDARTRADIVAAFRENKDFSSLSDEAIVEVSGMLNAIAGEAARANRTIAEQ